MTERRVPLCTRKDSRESSSVPAAGHRTQWETTRVLPNTTDLDRIRRERDLYHRLLELGSENELGPFLRDALALVVEVTGAHQGYLELHDDQGAENGVRWSIAHGFTDAEVETVRGAISRGIIAEALATENTIVTPSAVLDPRFRDR